MFRSQGKPLVFLLLASAVVNAFGEGSDMNQPTLPATASVDGTLDSERVQSIGIVDLYGLHRLTAKQILDELTFKVGDPVTPDEHALFEASKKRLMMIPGVSDARIEIVCCTDDRPVVFVGIEELHAPVLRFRPTPKGSISLTPEVVQTGEEFDRLRTKAVLSGHPEEDDSNGYTLLLDDGGALATENRMITIAARDLQLLRNVLRDAANSDHRALAAQLLGYAKDPNSVVPDLVYAMSDSAEGVRNNAMRALWVFTLATKIRAPRVPYKPFIALLNSLIWTDRNKSSEALMEMISTRDPRLLKMLREQALPSLVEMARWKDRNHAGAAFWILGNLAGMEDKDIFEDWDRNDRERVIAAALGH